MPAEIQNHSTEYIHVPTISSVQFNPSRYTGNSRPIFQIDLHTVSEELDILRATYLSTQAVASLCILMTHGQKSPSRIHLEDVEIESRRRCHQLQAQLLVLVGEQNVPWVLGTSGLSQQLFSTKALWHIHEYLYKAFASSKVMESFLYAIRAAGYLCDKLSKLELYVLVLLTMLRRDPTRGWLHRSHAPVAAEGEGS